MKNSITLLLLLIVSGGIFSQQIDYNTKKGAVANGYDVVSYFSNQVTKGDKKYVAKYDGVKFLFSSEKNLNAFNQNPTQYIPQYGGYCAYAISEKNQKMYIDPEIYEIRDNKLYLFYNPWIGSKLEEWQEGDVRKKQERGDKNWKILKHN